MSTETITFLQTEDNIIIRIPLDLLCFAAENNPDSPLIINDREQFAHEVAFQLEHNLGKIESGLSGFKELLDTAIIEVLESGHPSVDFDEEKAMKIINGEK